MGAMLRRAGHDVAMLGRENHLDAIARDGLRVSGLFGDHLASGFSLASDPARLEGPFDLILLTVKAYDTAAIADRIKHLLAPDGLVVSMQNGVGNLDVLVERFGRARVIGGRVMLGAEIRSPGRRACDGVRRTDRDRTLGAGESRALHPAVRTRARDRRDDDRGRHPD